MALGTVIRSFVGPGVASTGIGFDGYSLWIADRSTDIVYQLDMDGRILQSLAIPVQNPRALVSDGANLWVILDQGIFRRIAQINKTTGVEIRSIGLPGVDPSGGLGWDGRMLWHGDRDSDLIYQISPRSGSVVHSFAAPATQTTGIAFDGQALYIADRVADAIYKVNPATGTTILSFAASAEVADLTVDGRTIWYADGANTIYQASLN